MASLASVFAMVFCFSVVSLFQLPDAEAGEDQIVDIQDWKDNEEFSKVDVYLDYSDLPEDIEEYFCLTDKLPNGYSFSEMEVITVGQKVKIKSNFINEKGDSIVVKQKISNDYTEVIANSDRVETLNGLDVYIKNYTNGDKQTSYKFIVENTFVSIVAGNGVEEEVIKQIIKEAKNSLLGN